MDISIIIVNYNTRRVTQNCLNSIYEHTNGISFEVIVVDNNSQRDDSKKYLKEDNRIIFIENQENIGFGKANNLGYQFAKGKYIFLLNSDTILLNNAVKIFFNKMEELSAEVFCIGTRLKSPELSYNHSFGKFPSLKSTLIDVFKLYLKLFKIKYNYFDERKYDQLEQFEVDYIMGADLFIRKALVDKYGLFDPDFFMYFEESELQFRYRNEGFKSMIVSGPEIIHLESISFNMKEKYSYFQRRIFFRSMFLYMKKRYCFFVYFCFRIIYLFNFPIFLLPYYTFKEKIGLIRMLFLPITPQNSNFI